MQTSERNYTVPMIIIGALFFIFGFVTWLNGTLIPFLKLACDLETDAQALLVTSAFYMAYFFLAIPSSFILEKTGYKKGMSLGLVVMGVGALIFIPAANSREFGLFLTGLFVQGMGLALLQTASNPYISIVGPIESAAKRISIMGICNKVAGALSPLILSAIVLAGASEIESQINGTNDMAIRAQLLDSLAERVITPYVVMSVVLFVLAIGVWLSPLPELERMNDDFDESPLAKGKSSITQFPHLLLGALCIFVYVGAEVMAGDVIGPYGKAMGMSLDETKNFTSYTLWSMVVGYIIGILTIPRYLKQETALKYSAIVGMMLTFLALVTEGYTSILCIALMGFANSLMWPAIFPMAINGLGRFTKIGSALLIMGIVGGAIIPPVYGLLADTNMSAQMAFFIVVLPCYLYILYYAVAGHKAGQRVL